MPTISSSETRDNTSPNIGDLEALFGEILDLLDRLTGPWSDLLIPLDYREPLTEAWSELRGRAQEEFLVFIRNEENEPKLRAAGLAGAQLQLKLMGIRNAWGRFVMWGGVTRLHKLLEWLNDILGSLASVIPGVEAVDEIKKAIERLMSESASD